jgi:hypothetical protein
MELIALGENRHYHVSVKLGSVLICCEIMPWDEVRSESLCDSCTGVEASWKTAGIEVDWLKSPFLGVFWGLEPFFPTDLSFLSFFPNMGPLLHYLAAAKVS